VEKGDAAFDTKKRLLGWDVDSQSLTLHLPNRRSERIGDLLASFLSRKYTTRKQWYNLLGKLCSITLALHSSPYLFSILQTPLTKNTHRFWLTRMLKLALQDWTNLIHHMSLRPVHITSVAPHAPHYVTSVNSSSGGMRGWWLPTILTNDAQPCIWRSPFPVSLCPSNRPWSPSTTHRVSCAIATWNWQQLF